MTADIPCVGGVIKEGTDDFRVRNFRPMNRLAARKHLDLRIEKNRRSQLVGGRRMAQSFRFAERMWLCRHERCRWGLTVQTVSLRESRRSLLLGGYNRDQDPGGRPAQQQNEVGTLQGQPFPHCRQGCFCDAASGQRRYWKRWLLPACPTGRRTALRH